MTREELLGFPEMLMRWFLQDPLAAGLVSAALVLIMLAVVLRWAVRRPAAAVTSEAVTAVDAEAMAVRVEPVVVAAEPAPVIVPRRPLVATPEELSERMDDLAEEVIALRRQLCDTEALLRRQADKLNYFEQQLPVAPAPLRVQDDDSGRQAGYEQAMLLAANGLPVQELMVQCGLTRPEAQLIVLLHGRGGQA